MVKNKPSLSSFPNSIYGALKKLKIERYGDEGSYKLNCPWALKGNIHQALLTDTHEYRCEVCKLELNTVKFVFKLAKLCDMTLYTVLNTICYTPLHESEKPVFFNIEHNITRDYSMQKVTDMLSHPRLVSWYKTNCLVYCSFEYNPHKTQSFRDPITNERVYNIYVPPEWKSNKYFNKADIPLVKEMPDIYRDFFMHLVDNKPDSYTYFVDWISNSIKSRNFAYLILLGEEGVGKGVFGEILRGLHGKENFRGTGNRILTTNFNDELLNRTMIYIDEVDISKGTKDKKADKEAESRLKSLINDFQEFEGKFRDRKESRSYASYYLSANEKSAIPISGDDRRYSFLAVNKIPLVNSNLLGNKKVADFIDKLKDPKNIARLAQYLWHHKIVSDMERPFSDADQLEDIKEAISTGWEQWLAYNWIPDNQGRTISLGDMQSVLSKQFPTFTPPGRPLFESFVRKYKNIISMRQCKDNRSKRYFVIKDTDNTIQEIDEAIATECDNVSLPPTNDDVDDWDKFDAESEKLLINRTSTKTPEGRATLAMKGK